MKRIAIIQGHPDPNPERFCHVLAVAYTDGARDAGHEVRMIEVARLDFPLLRTRVDFESGATPPAIADAQATIAWAEHVVIVFPLWLGDIPALLKGFLEQVLRPGFAFHHRERGAPEKLMRGRSVRIVVTMGMPGFFYEWFYRAHSVKSLERNVFAFVGFGPVRRTVIGMVESDKRTRNAAWLERMRALGAEAR
jgi:putative NADPH-quinone reductase